MDRHGEGEEMEGADWHFGRYIRGFDNKFSIKF